MGSLSMFRLAPIQAVGGFLLLFAAAVSVQATDKTVEETYPGLARGILKAATLQELKDGVVLNAGKVSISESEVLEAVEQSDPAMAGQLRKNLVFLLEQMAIERLLLAEAKEAGYGTNGEDPQAAIEAFLGSKASQVTVTELSSGPPPEVMVPPADIAQA